ncbi:MAG: NAD-dependent epimerase/dehydratase family protein [Saprospiraceae bacterium]|nr:NAD-dependent epimerase/dehydratase family protein [Saprospiraceae bacterium]MBK9222166.1 NAD-dependent epimerase/dehydratase family protein [Saprospiraceae bacterium]
MQKERILMLGANGQIGTVLADALRTKFGGAAVVTSDLRNPVIESGPHEILNVLDLEKLNQLIDKHQITQIYHLAAILSATGEKDPMSTWNINMQGLLNVLNVAVEKKIHKVFYPSTIAIFGPSTPKHNTAQESSFIPTTVYGMSKLAGENWCNYYHKRYGLDVRSVRYPGVIGWQSAPGGGTTDYAVEIFYDALKFGKYTCFLEAETRLPMIYMEDSIRATIELMDADVDKISVRTSYNLASMSFTPAELAAEIKQHIPDFQIQYAPDFRQAIAASWSESIDDQMARKDWQWLPNYDLSKMTADMFYQLRLKEHEKQ